MDERTKARTNRRLALQAELDAGKSGGERNRLGQFATPPALAEEMLRLAGALLPRNAPVRFLDPAFGTGAFYAALLASFPAGRVTSAQGYEVDPHYGGPAGALWAGTGLDLVLGDFTQAVAPVAECEKATLVVCNPPYVRHHHLDVETKGRLRAASLQAAGVDLNGLAGLYCHFVCLCQPWMAKGALAMWLVPSEFMDVNYGRPLKEYLLRKVTLLRIHRFDPSDVQFGDALVSSAVVCFVNSPPRRDQAVDFTFGGTLQRPRHRRTWPAEELDAAGKWTGLALAGSSGRPAGDRAKLADLFAIRRGIATGSNEFFVMGEAAASIAGIPRRFLRPILPSPRYLPSDEIAADAEGNPLIERRLFLLDCRLPPEQIRQRYLSLWRYLSSEAAQRIRDRYLCRHRTLIAPTAGAGQRLCFVRAMMCSWSSCGRSLNICE